jgi:hypothetical protein
LAEAQLGNGTPGTSQSGWRVSAPGGHPPLAQGFAPAAGRGRAVDTPTSRTRPTHWPVLLGWAMSNGQNRSGFSPPIAGQATVLLSIPVQASPFLRKQVSASPVCQISELSGKGALFLKFQTQFIMFYFTIQKLGGLCLLF